MNAFAWPAANAAPAAPLPALSALAGQAGNVPLTRVSLAYLEHRFKLYLRFGEPARTLQLDRWRRCAVFLPASMFCRIRWESNDYGTTRWQLMVRTLTAAGLTQFNTDPSGASTWMGRYSPALEGMSGPTRVFTA